MSGRQEHKKRYNTKLQFIREWDKWMEQRPPIIKRKAFKLWLQKEPILAYNVKTEREEIIK